MTWIMRNQQDRTMLARYLETQDTTEQDTPSYVAACHDSIQRADYSNPTVSESVRSTLVSILGRTAAYQGRVVTWDELLRSDERLVPDLKGLTD
jgi:hypothetical protein